MIPAVAGDLLIYCLDLASPFQGCVCVCVRAPLSKYQNMPSNYKLVLLVPCPLPSTVDFLGLNAPLFKARVSIGPTYSKSLKWLCFFETSLRAAWCLFIPHS